MPDLTALAAAWNRAYNGPLPCDPVLGYLLVSVWRLLIAWAAWLMLRALARYLAVAFPPPHTPANTMYWLRWWLWLRLREHPALKIGAAGMAVLLVLQIPAGLSGSLNTATLYLLLVYPAQLALLIGLARLFHSLSNRIEHPTD